MLSFIASRVKKTVNGMPTGSSPSVAGIRELFERIDEDPCWHPGKRSGEKPGPKRLLRGAKVTAIVSAAKRLKREGNDPT